MTHRAFPPGRDLILVPSASRKAALAGLSLYAPCTRKAVMAHRLAWTAISVLGPSALPGRPAEWDPPPGREAWGELLDHWRKITGEFDDIAIYQPRQLDRPRAAFMLLSDGAPLGFVKLRLGEGEKLAKEAAAVDSVRKSRPYTFSVPGLMGQGRVQDWHYLVMEPMPVRRHIPAWKAPLERVVDEVQESLCGLPRSDSVPRHWEPKHGDLAVWNLRRIGRSRLVLVDWEHAGWGPPKTDEVYFRVMAAAIRSQPAQPMQGVEEAVGYWRQQPQFQLGPAENLDNEFVRRALETLNRLA